MLREGLPFCSNFRHICKNFCNAGLAQMRETNREQALILHPGKGDANTIGRVLRHPFQRLRCMISETAKFAYGVSCSDQPRAFAAVRNVEDKLA
jgi:hypothetical protein